MVAAVSRWKLSVCALSILGMLITALTVASHRDAVAGGAAGPDHARTAELVTPVSVSTSACGKGWNRPAAGRQRFVVHNTDYRAADVSLTTKAGAVLGEVESIGAGATANLRVELGRGRYTFRCAMEDADVVTGPTVRVSGQRTGGSPAVSPVSQADLIPATLRYEHDVRQRLPRLLGLVRRLAGDIRTRDLTAAKRDWLAGHLEYERLGAAYGAFGAADGRINGLPDGLPGGVHAKGFTGFHRIEYDLWRARTGPATVAMSDRLVVSVRRLAKSFATAQIDPIQVSVRAHEIAENTLQLELTGQTDLGSGSGLATANANLTATAGVLRLLEPLLRSRYARLPRLEHALTRTRHDLRAMAHDGRFPTLDSLTRRRRERVDADFSGLTELLAPVASICEPRRS
jgi:iron uptake system component EfeO